MLVRVASIPAFPASTKLDLDTNAGGLLFPEVPLHKKLDDLHEVMSDGQTTTTGPMMCETIDSLWSMRTPTLPMTDDMAELQWLRTKLTGRGSKACQKKTKLYESTIRELWTLREKRLADLQQQNETFRVRLQQRETEVISLQSGSELTTPAGGSSTAGGSNTADVTAPGAEGSTTDVTGGAHHGDELDTVRQGPRHMRQLFARVRGGAIAQRYRSSHGRRFLDEMGIKVPDGTTFQLHRGGETGGFVIVCRSEADAQALWQRKMEYFRMHPSHQLSIQRKRPDRERPRVVDRTSAIYHQMQQRLCDQRHPQTNHGYRGDGLRAARKTPQQPQSKQQQQQQRAQRGAGDQQRPGGGGA